MAVQALEQVIGIGASAGGLEAMLSLIGCLPEALPNSAIIIAQHLSPDYKSMLVELLGRKTTITVSQANNNTKLEPNHIYVAPPSDDVVVEKGLISLRPPGAIGAHPSVDVLLASIAKSYRNRAVGIVLSGTGKDGSKGIQAIVNSGGLAIVQEPGSAKYEGMPKAAIGTGAVQYVLTPEKIGQKLRSFVGEEPEVEEAADLPPGEEDAFIQILQLLEQRIGIDFSGYKFSTLSRRLAKRLTEHRLDNEQEYLKYIEQHPEELDVLFQTVLIGVTSFFRDTVSFERIGKLLEELIANKTDKEPIRIWVAGCASGEEAYSYAMLALEALEKADKHFALQIFATDVDLKGLHMARIGVYESSALQKVPAELLKKYFKKLNNGKYEVRRELRRVVLFSRHDVTANPPFLRIDVLSCRNLLIYFNNQLQRRVLPLFYYALKKHGVMVLGKSENIGKFDQLFAIEDATNKIFRKKETDKHSIRFPELQPHRAANHYDSEASRQDLSLSDRIKDSLFANYHHPFVLTDEHFDIVELHGDCAPFLKLRSGSASLNLVKLMAAELQIELRALLNSALTDMKPISGGLHLWPLEDPKSLLRLHIKPVSFERPNSRYLLVIFETMPLEPRLLTRSAPGEGESPRVEELENQLDDTKLQMNSLLEELETSNEELQALNEEMQASNEELQAANEELETSNEELQATNEELENAYSELREANVHIEQQKQAIEASVHNMDSLLNNTLIGFVLIDAHYKILSANQTAKTIYHQLFKSKLKEGLSYVALLPDEYFSSFNQQFKRALSGEQVIAEECFSSANGSKFYYDVNYTPVITNDSQKADAVSLSLVDITKRKQVEADLLSSNKELAEERQFMHTLTENLPSLVWTADNQGHFTYTNRLFVDSLHLSKNQQKKLSWPLIVHPDDADITATAWQKMLRTHQPFMLEHRLKTGRNSYEWFFSVAHPVTDDNRSVRFWAGSSTNIESIKTQQAMAASVEQMRSERENLLRINHVKDEFIGMASHQLRTPATAVKQYLNLLISGFGGELTAEQQRYLQVANESNERQLSVINDLLKTAQLDAKDRDIVKSTYNIADMVRTVASECQPVLELKNQTFKLSTPDQVLASVDYDELKLALINLVENASKYSYDKTQIEINVKETKGSVRIAVSDQGVGIKRADQPRIFEKFTRIDNELSDTVRGTGLGLYWVKRIAELHGGNITVDSKPKQGSVFTMELPG